MNMIHRFMGCIREYKKPTILTLLCMVGEVAIEVLIPFFTANLVNEIKGGAELSGVVRVGLGLILMSLVSLGCGALGGLYGSRASAGFAKNVRHDVFTRVQSFAFENIDKFSSASLVTRMTTDINNVQMSFMMCIRIAVRAPLMFLFAVIMAYIMGGALATTFLIIIPVLVIGLLLIARKAMPAFRAVFRKYDKLNESVEENVRAMRVVKGFAREGYEKQKFAAASHDIAKDFTFAERVVALNAPLMQSCIYACMIIISWLGAKAIIASGNDPALGLTTGNLTALITYAMQILSSLMMLSMVFAMLTISLSSARRIAEVIEEKTDIQNPEHPVMAVRDGAIDFDHVSFVYASKADKKVLDDIEQKPDFIVLDPPRDGIHPKALEKIISYGVEKMVYISCKPTSLARDLEVLLARGYEAERICCVDMFPQTTGIETVCLLGKRKPDAKVKIGIDMDDYYRIRENAESK